eukprot:6459577-Amphidinium_carterae.1
MVRCVAMGPNAVSGAGASIGGGMTNPSVNARLPRGGGAGLLRSGAGLRVGFELQGVLDATELYHHRSLWRVRVGPDKPGSSLPVRVERMLRVGVPPHTPEDLVQIRALK